MVKQVKNELGSIIFAMGYISDFRYYKQMTLEKEYENIQNIICDLTTEQYESLRQMIEVEMIANAIQYCCDLGSFAVSVKHSTLAARFLSDVSTLKEDRLNDIFFKPIKKGNYDLVSRYMGYHEIEIKENDQRKYSDSCDRYKADITKLSEFFNHWYYLYTAYKHGLRLIPVIENNTHQKIILMAHKDNTWRPYVVSETWWREAIDITIIVHEMFRKLYIPLVRKKFGDRLGFSFDSPSISAQGKSKDSYDPTKEKYLDRMNFNFPWWIHEPGELNPFY
jgi:hypothetical protein